MKLKSLFILLVLISAISAVSAADDVTGLWKSIDDETGQPTSISMLYMYQGELYGRILITYDDLNPGVIMDTYMEPGVRAELLVGEPPFAGLDFIWGLQDRGRRWGRGNILDPKKGKVYASEVWMEGDNLILRGKIGPFGRSQTWLPVSTDDLPSGFIIPEASSLEPRIPQVK